MNDETQWLHGQCLFNNFICIISDLLFSLFMTKKAVRKKHHAQCAANFCYHSSQENKYYANEIILVCLYTVPIKPLVLIKRAAKGDLR